MCPKELHEPRLCDLVPSAHHPPGNFTQKEKRPTLCKRDLLCTYLQRIRPRPKVAIKLWQPVDEDRDDARAAPNVADTPLAKAVRPKIPLLAMESENTSLFLLLDTELAQVFLQAADSHQPPEVPAMRIAHALSVVELHRPFQHLGIAVCGLVVVS